MLVFNCDLADANEMQQKGAPANGRIFKDAGILSYWYLTVPTNSAHPNAAALLAGLLLSKEGAGDSVENGEDEFSLCRRNLHE